MGGALYTLSSLALTRRQEVRAGAESLKRAESLPTLNHICAVSQFRYRFL
jgi:hypothetical protein